MCYYNIKETSQHIQEEILNTFPELHYNQFATKIDIVNEMREGRRARNTKPKIQRPSWIEGFYLKERDSCDWDGIAVKAFFHLLRGVRLIAQRHDSASLYKSSSVFRRDVSRIWK